MSLLYLSKEGVATHQNAHLTDNQSITSLPPSLVSAKTTFNSNPVVAKFATVTIILFGNGLIDRMCDRCCPTDRRCWRSLLLWLYHSIDHLN